jgi:hypothetical protein
LGGSVLRGGAKRKHGDKQSDPAVSHKVRSLRNLDQN